MTTTTPQQIEKLRILRRANEKARMLAKKRLSGHNGLGNRHQCKEG